MDACTTRLFSVSNYIREYVLLYLVYNVLILACITLINAEFWSRAYSSTDVHK